MLLDLTNTKLGWPSRGDVLQPPGPGARIYADLAKKKLEAAVRRQPDGRDVHVGVLTANPASEDTEAPLAIVCEFPGRISDKTLRLCLRLAWNFCRSPQLITLEPHLVRSWSCYEEPVAPNDPLRDPLETLHIGADGAISLQAEAARALHWVELASGDFLRKHDARFKKSARADQLLLENLKHIRKLLTKSLSQDIIHDLLARLIFIQFLSQRKDSDGRAALDADRLIGLCREGVLHDRIYHSLDDILTSHGDTYRFFRWLNERFNGDLFPGKAGTPEEREAEWQREMAAVKQSHLRLLADFISGKLQMRQGQYCLWPQYSFDTIPLDLISSIYEEFVSARGGGQGAHYTPGHLVDFILDEVLPWGGQEWDIRVLDPACGSGIFLVKTFQRLVQRWKNANSGERPPASVLRRILENNLYGVDTDPHAVRVASFSLYLAMCDEIDPRYYWEQVRFPPMRGRRLINADFFDESVPGFRTIEDARTYDLVVGNAPWGRETMTCKASDWARDHDWIPINDQIGTLFLPKAAHLARPNGYISMLQPAGALLFNRTPTSMAYRRRFFANCQVREVVNLSALRFVLFKDAISPTCIVTLQPRPSDGSPLSYCSPKPTYTAEDDERIPITPADINWVYPHEAAQDPFVWTALAWGGRRDLELVRRLSERSLLASLPGKNRRKGIVRGDRRLAEPRILDRPLLDSPEQLPDGPVFIGDPTALPLNGDPCIDERGVRKLTPFEPPQLIIRKAWPAGGGRFRAVLYPQAPGNPGVVCSQSFISIHGDPQDADLLEAACLGLNSIVALYHLLLTSGRFASFIPEPLLVDFLGVPIPQPTPGLLAGLKSFEDIDERARDAFGLKEREAEWALIEDLSAFTLPDFKGDSSSPGRQPTLRDDDDTRNLEPDLAAYCRYFTRVLKAGFGNDKAICCTILSDHPDSRLPVRLVAIHLGWQEERDVHVEMMDYPALVARLLELDRQFIGTNGRHDGGIFYQRSARLYSTAVVAGHRVPTVYIIKPDERRFWTRSMAMRDADEVTLDMLTCREAASEQPLYWMENTGA